MTTFSNVMICEPRAVSSTFLKSVRHHLMELVIRCNESLVETNNFTADLLRLLINETLDSNVSAL